ncbi:unnamed protein product [Colias eurytheme]|nr:unnamed protein product [Colias eurytheme]
MSILPRTSYMFLMRALITDNTFVAVIRMALCGGLAGNTRPSGAAVGQLLLPAHAWTRPAPTSPAIRHTKKNQIRNLFLSVSSNDHLKS